jgi:mannosyl-oligosaccharide alpha-1,2-mannosidase
MYLKTIEAVRKWLLFRPMIPGNHDILFSGSIMTDGKPGTRPRFDTEIHHLTCFIGGMVGMGAQIFDIKGDLEVAKKLTDGCVWAYGSMPAEIMAEAAQVLPCESAENCVWNETVYYDYIDPRGEERDRTLENYLADRAARKAEKEAAEKAAEEEAAEKAAETKVESEEIETRVADHQSAADNEPRDISNSTSILIQKRQVAERDGLSQPLVRDSENGPAGPQSDVPLPAGQTKAVVEARDLHQPLSHMEFVAEQIKQNRLPPGYVKVRVKKYILR